MTIRTRFAPSPTGHVHIGNIRTAIYNWLFARNQGGQFLLRIEDTDRERSTPEACQTVLGVMAWLGLDFDETPVYQSTMQETHLAAAEDLLARGLAYKEDKGGTGQGEAVVFRVPEKEGRFKDLVKGELSKAAEHMQDFVIVRSNGTPVFHLANVVDDIHMGITHVIRGDDHVENTYRHLALYEALGADLPHFAHLPMITNAQGKPYSKRDGDAYVGDFKRQGFLPDALLNYLTLLGWSPGDDREVMPRHEIIDRFSLERVQSSAAQMDRKKLEWMNGEHMKRLSHKALLGGVLAALNEVDWWKDSFEASLPSVLQLMADRIKFFHEAPAQTQFFFTDEYPVDEKNFRKRMKKEESQTGLKKLKGAFADEGPWQAATLEKIMNDVAEAENLGVGQIMPACRLAVSGAAGGPSLFELLELLGRDRVLQRIEKALEKAEGLGE